MTNNREYAEKIRSLSSFGMKSAFKREGDFSIPSFNVIGYNYKLSDINSAVVLEQLKKYPRILNKKRMLAHFYDELLEKNDYVKIPVDDDDNFNVFQTYVITLHPGINRNKLITALKKDGVQTTIGTYASHIQKVYNSKDICPNSLCLFNHSLALPLFYAMTKEEVKEVVNKLNKHIRRLLDNR